MVRATCTLQLFNCDSELPVQKSKSYAYSKKYRGVVRKNISFEVLIAFFMHVTFFVSKLTYQENIFFTTRNIIFMSKKMRNTSVDIVIQFLIEFFYCFDIKIFFQKRNFMI